MNISAKVEQFTDADAQAVLAGGNAKPAEEAGLVKIAGD
jgi:hypothetical protein